MYYLNKVLQSNYKLNKLRDIMTNIIKSKSKNNKLIYLSNDKLITSNNNNYFESFKNNSNTNLRLDKNISTSENIYLLLKNFDNFVTKITVNIRKSYINNFSKAPKKIINKPNYNKDTANNVISDIIAYVKKYEAQRDKVNTLNHKIESIEKYLNKIFNLNYDSNINIFQNVNVYRDIDIHKLIEKYLSVKSNNILNKMLYY